MGITKITKALKAEKIPRPAYVRAVNGEGYPDFLDEKKAYSWDCHVVRDILNNAVYTGAIVGGKQVKISLKSKKRKRSQKGEIVMENCHEAIIEPTEWRLVQELITSRRRDPDPDKPRYDNIFAGLVKCADCGHSLVIRHINRKIVNGIQDTIDYQCNTYRLNGKEVCAMHKITANQLYDAVLADIQRWARMAVKNEDKLLDELSKKFSRAGKEKSKQNERELKKAKKRLAEIDKLYATLYESFANGKVNERNFATLSANYETEQAELEEKIRDLSVVIEADEVNGRNAENFVELIKPYAKIYKLTQPILNSLIERIDVHEPAEFDSELVQKVDVHYKLVGNLG